MIGLTKATLYSLGNTPDDRDPLIMLIIIGNRLIVQYHTVSKWIVERGQDHMICLGYILSVYWLHLIRHYAKLRCYDSFFYENYYYCRLTDFICKQIYCYATSGIALMMSSAHCFSHIVLICIVVSYGLTLRKAV